MVQCSRKKHHNSGSMRLYKADVEAAQPGDSTSKMTSVEVMNVEKTRRVDWTQINESNETQRMFLNRRKTVFLLFFLNIRERNLWTKKARIKMYISNFIFSVQNIEACKIYVSAFHSLKWCLRTIFTSAELQWIPQDMGCGQQRFCLG